MTSGATPREIYSERLAARTRTLAERTRRRDNLGTLRLAVFLIAAAVAWFAATTPLSFWWLAIPASLFLALVRTQAGVERQMQHAQRAIRFHEQGIARLEHRWQGALGSDGARFRDPHHPYADDLDLFGHASLFELLSTARTAGGENRLAAWLKAPAPLETLRARHAAIAELRPLLDLREQLAVLAADCTTGIDPARIAEWSLAPVRRFPRPARIAALILSVITAALLLFWLGSANPDARLAMIAFGILEASIGVPFRPRILAITSAVDAPAHDLELYSQILAVLEKHHFTSPHLASLHASLATGESPASIRIAKLRRLMDMLDSRENPIVRAIGPLILWTTQLGMAIEAWRAENGAHIPAWLDAIAEIEALSSLAGYAWEHPADPFPEFAPASDESQPHFEGENLGHPLLAEDANVRNSVRLAPPLRLLLVSGSNMSGKSTLLRTVGVNTVLALAGAPVRAARLTISRMSLGASIQTFDSLEQGRSRFMAEILRLRQILDLAPPALFLLDELLGGTNSHDRAIGSEGLIRALLDRGAVGLVTTHDLSLARIAADLGPAAANVHFEDHLEEGKLVFDYAMRPGVVTRSNALDLMRAVGLDV